MGVRGDFVTIVAAIYLPKPGRDKHYHAWSKCTHGGIRIREDGNYHVNTEQFVRGHGRVACPGAKCWTPLGYHPEWEVEAE
jgi:hypothetical protein